MTGERCNRNGINNNEFFESCSSTEIKCVKLRHTWTIKNFSAFSSKTYEKLVSPVFSTEGNSDDPQWCLWMFPNGDIKGNTHCIGLYLKLVKCKVGEVQTTYRLGIVNARGKYINYLHNSNLIKTGSLAGHARFVQRELLLNQENGLLPNDQLTVYCEITAAVGIENLTHFTGRAERKNDEAMVQNEMKAQLTDAEEQSLYQILNYVFTGKREKLNNWAFSLVANYAVNDLKTMCEQALVKGLSLKNVAKFFYLSDKFRATELKSQIKKFIAANASALGDTPEFTSMFLEYPYLGVEAFRALKDNSAN